MQNTIRDNLCAAIEGSGFSYTLADARADDVPLIYANKAFQDLTGYGQEEILGRNCRFLQGPETNKDAVKRIRHALQTKSPVSTMLLNYRKDGSKFWNRFQLSPVRDENGEVTAFLGAQVDLTQDHTIDALEQERQKIESLGRLAGGVAHELNNALQPPLLMAEMLEDMLGDFAEARRETAKECIAKIIEHTNFAKSVVSQILDFSRRSEANLSIAPIALCVEDAVAFAQTLIPVGVTVTVNYAPEISVKSHYVNVSRNALRQVFNNLFLNAYHAMSGEGCLSVKVYAPTQEESDIRNGQKKGVPHVAISVTDTGPGIKPETLPHIFEPFFTTKGVGAGTGLGLSTVYSIVRSWGGSIVVENQVGMVDEPQKRSANRSMSDMAQVRGACFTLYIPLQPNPKDDER